MCFFLTYLYVTSGDVDATSCLFVYITLDKVNVGLNGVLINDMPFWSCSMIVC